MIAHSFSPDESLLVLVGDSGGFQAFFKVYNVASGRQAVLLSLTVLFPGTGAQCLHLRHSFLSSGTRTMCAGISMHHRKRSPVHKPLQAVRLLIRVWTWQRNTNGVRRSICAGCSKPARCGACRRTTTSTPSRHSLCFGPRTAGEGLS